jgi:hypothetical protein
VQIGSPSTTLTLHDIFSSKRTAIYAKSVPQKLDFELSTYKKVALSLEKAMQAHRVVKR